MATIRPIYGTLSIYGQRGPYLGRDRHQTIVTHEETHYNPRRNQSSTNNRHTKTRSLPTGAALATTALPKLPPTPVHAPPQTHPPNPPHATKPPRTNHVKLYPQRERRPGATCSEKGAQRRRRGCERFGRPPGGGVGREEAVAGVGEARGRTRAAQGDER